MKKILGITSAIVFLIMTASASFCEEANPSAKDTPAKEEPSLVKWASFDEGMKTAAKKNLPLYVEFYATWCPPCKEMARTTFRNTDVAKMLNEEFVSVKVDIDKERDLALRYGARSIPHHVVMDSKGEILKVLRGGLPADMFMTILKETTKK